MVLDTTEEDLGVADLQLTQGTLQRAGWPRPRWRAIPKYSRGANQPWNSHKTRDRWWITLVARGWI